MKLPVAEVQALVSRQLQRAGASAATADCTACALVLAESKGLGSCGLSRIGLVCTCLGNGLALAACELAVPQGMLAARAAQTHGGAFVGVIRGDHCAVLVDDLRPAAEAGMAAIRLANSPVALPAAGAGIPSSAPAR